MPRIVLHLDLDAFFCAVEELRDPSLRGKPFAVGGRPEGRGVVASCSYAARNFGIHSAMPVSQALRLCPELLIISHHNGNYGEMSEKVMQRLHDLSPQVEQISIDEAFVDISDLGEVPETIAHILQKRVNNEVGLPCSIGVATNKLVAKIATEVGKKTAKKGQPPNAIIVVPPGMEKSFLDPLPTNMLWGVGPKTATKLAGNGINTIGDLAHRPVTDLIRWFGENGRDMAHRACGVDDSPITSGHEVKSISTETTFTRDVRDDKVLAETLRQLSAQVGRRLRKAEIASTTIKIKIRWPDFTSLTRQITLTQPTDQDEEIFHQAMELFMKVREKGKAVRLIGVSASGLCPPMRQLELWGPESEKSHRLQEAMNLLRAKYGEKAIQRGKRK